MRAELIGIDGEVKGSDKSVECDRRNEPRCSVAARLL